MSLELPRPQDELVWRQDYLHSVSRGYRRLAEATPAVRRFSHGVVFIIGNQHQLEHISDPNLIG
ncbi:MAG: hypothetical protein CL410_01130 [Acidimicrobiaceae bacterium]|nr:hypothetical protein [Acidimicrobiaceae bacterium]